MAKFQTGDDIMMKIYTKTGDKGKTRLYDNTEVDKDSIRVEAYGTIDELNSMLGLAKSLTEYVEIKNIVIRVQRELFDVGGELATTDGGNFPEKITEENIQWFEEEIDNLLYKIGKDQMFQFILPGTNSASGAMHCARTICRRAERRIITLSREAEIRPMLIKYVNRLSDLIYTMARYMEDEEQKVEFKKD